MIHRCLGQLALAAVLAGSTGCINRGGVFRSLADLPMNMARDTIANINEQQRREAGERADEFAWEKRAGEQSEAWQ